MDSVMDLVPLLILLGIVVFFLRFSWRRSTANMDRAIASNDEIVCAMNAAVFELREIKAILKDRR